MDEIDERVQEDRQHFADICANLDQRVREHHLVCPALAVAPLISFILFNNFFIFHLCFVALHKCLRGFG